MHLKKLRCLLFLVVVPAFVAQEAPPAIDPAATALWAEHARGMGSRTEGRVNVDFDLVSGKAIEFFEKYPAERRVGGILFNLSSFGDWLGQDERSAKLSPAWRKHLRGVVAEALQKKTWPDNIWSGLNWLALRNEIAIQKESAAAPDLPGLRARIDAVAARTPSAPYRVFMEQNYLEQLREHDAASVIGFLRAIAASEVPDLAKLGNGELAVEDIRQHPMELKFTAVDGTEVDLAKLRGQVVLIDCWATWCVPCIKELPNIKAALAKWGSKGFTVVGISFDRDADRAKLVEFIAKEKLDWPHWFNDAGGRNPFGIKYNIRSIPATFLLGRDGRLVTTDTHGAKLEAALEKLLGQ
jgi:thiol-disulfide isomerase/thioredoxin